jgi:hypothetical protein
MAWTLSGRPGARPCARVAPGRRRPAYGRDVNVTTATQVLGLPGRGLDRDELVGAWRRYARAHHPDRCPGDRGAAWRFATGREAFETLIAEVVDRPPVPVVAYGRTGVVRGASAARALPYEMRPLHTREWRA